MADPMTLDPAPTPAHFVIAAAESALANGGDLPDLKMIGRFVDIPTIWWRAALDAGGLPGDQGRPRLPVAEQLLTRWSSKTGKPVPPNLSAEQVIFVVTLWGLTTGEA